MTIGLADHGKPEERPGAVEGFQGKRGRPLELFPKVYAQERRGTAAFDG